MFWGDTLGASYIHSRLDSWSKTFGNFFKPSTYLADRAAKGVSLVANLSSLFTSTSVIYIFFVLLRHFICSHLKPCSRLIPMQSAPVNQAKSQSRL